MPEARAARCRAEVGRMDRDNRAQARFAIGEGVDALMMVKVGKVPHRGHRLLHGSNIANVRNIVSQRPSEASFDRKSVTAGSGDETRRRQPLRCGVVAGREAQCGGVAAIAGQPQLDRLGPGLTGERQQQGVAVAAGNARQLGRQSDSRRLAHQPCAHPTLGLFAHIVGKADADVFQRQRGDGQRRKGVAGREGRGHPLDPAQMAAQHEGAMHRPRLILDRYACAPDQQRERRQAGIQRAQRKIAEPCIDQPTVPHAAGDAACAETLLADAGRAQHQPHREEDEQRHEHHRTEQRRRPGARRTSGPAPPAEPR
ncbi:hypothetical protein WR25_00491 [Diploscapter pachys]|uniref:Uncharacterized protein n=1 Tax=Diploscapter pachys TaxID=2018661 RepID=A0A2A2M3B1_9BILA|nr:hypothetical protein WR25_00491 [Diploscapter pachys]